RGNPSNYGFTDGSSVSSELSFFQVDSGDFPWISSISGVAQPAGLIGQDCVHWVDRRDIVDDEDRLDNVGCLSTLNKLSLCRSECVVTDSPTKFPTLKPTKSPTKFPTLKPTKSPT